MERIRVIGGFSTGRPCGAGTWDDGGEPCFERARFRIYSTQDERTDMIVRCGPHALSWLVGNLGRLSDSS